LTSTKASGANWWMLNPSSRPSTRNTFNRFMQRKKEVEARVKDLRVDKYTAVNSRGYEIDLIRGFPPPELADEEHPVQMTPHEEDLWAVRASTGEKLLSGPRFSQVVIGTGGAMARMNTVHPLAFARINRELAADPARDPRKAPKDTLQAQQVEALVREYLPHLARELDAPPRTH
jgi:hypothetical protein